MSLQQNKSAACGLTFSKQHSQPPKASQGGRAPGLVPSSRVREVEIVLVSRQQWITDVAVASKGLLAAAWYWAEPEGLSVLDSVYPPQSGLGGPRLLYLKGSSCLWPFIASVLRLLYRYEEGFNILRILIWGDMQATLAFYSDELSHLKNTVDTTGSLATMHKLRKKIIFKGS